MKIPINILLDALERELTEERCDGVALALAGFVASKGGPVGKLLGGLVYGAIDQATPEGLIKALRKVFPENHEVEVHQ